MRFTPLMLLLSALFIATPSFAGAIVDARSSWQPSKCTPPQGLAAKSHDPEEAADSLNERIMQHNQFVAEAQNYMNCVSQEAQADADAASQSIIRSAQAIIQQTQAQVAASSARLQTK